MISKSTKSQKTRNVDLKDIPRDIDFEDLLKEIKKRRVDNKDNVRESNGVDSTTNDIKINTDCIRSSNIGSDESDGEGGVIIKKRTIRYFDHAD